MEFYEKWVSFFEGAHIAEDFFQHRQCFGDVLSHSGAIMAIGANGDDFSTQLLISA